MRFEQGIPSEDTIGPFARGAGTKLKRPTFDGPDIATGGRRTMLAAVGSHLLSLFPIGRAGAAMESHYTLVQGSRCVPIQPIRAVHRVVRFYDYRLPEEYVSDENGGPAGTAERYASVGTEEFQRPRTSIAFLYRGPAGLSLAFVHGDTDASDGGAVTFRISGFPESGEWVVKDDLYREPTSGELAETNYDRWQVEESTHRIHWTWGRNGTDGGVFRGLGDEFDVVVRPAFNENASLYGDHFEGQITDWQFLSGPVGDPERIPLALDQPLRIRTGTCE